MYYYLCASLPMLKFGEPPFLDLAGLTESCRSQLSAADFAVFSRTELEPTPVELPPASLAARYRDWETALRNRLVRRRAQQLGLTAEKFLREEPECFPDLELVIQNLGAQENPLERERTLNLARWRQLEQLSALHDFDLDAVLAYKLKLELLTRTVRRKNTAGLAAFEALAGKI